MRAKFESLCESDILDALANVADALEGAGLKAKEMGTLLLVGGSTQIPKIRQSLRSYFPDSKLDVALGNGEAAVYGAALPAAALANDYSESTGIVDVLLIDALPSAIGVQTSDGELAVIVPRNASVPAWERRTFTNANSNQTDFFFPFHQGNAPTAVECDFPGVFRLRASRSYARGTARMEIEIFLDQDNLPALTATEIGSGRAATFCDTLGVPAHPENQEPGSGVTITYAEE